MHVAVGDLLPGAQQHSETPRRRQSKNKWWFDAALFKNSSKLLFWSERVASCRLCPLGVIKKPLTVSKELHHKQSLMTLFWPFKDAHHTEHLSCLFHQSKWRRRLLHWSQIQALWFTFPLSNKPAESLVPAVHLVSGCRRHQVFGVGVSCKEPYIKVHSTRVCDMNKTTA